MWNFINYLLFQFDLKSHQLYKSLIRVHLWIFYEPAVYGILTNLTYSSPKNCPRLHSHSNGSLTKLSDSVLNFILNISGDTFHNLFKTLPYSQKLVIISCTSEYQPTSVLRRKLSCWHNLKHKGVLL
jgi:hypothetical protein